MKDTSLTTHYTLHGPTLSTPDFLAICFLRSRILVACGLTGLRYNDLLVFLGFTVLKFWLITSHPYSSDFPASTFGQIWT